MLKLIKEYKKIIILLSFAYIYILAILLAPSKLSVLTPGETTDVSTIYDIEGVEIYNNFASISVYSWKNVSVFQKWIVENNPKYDLYKPSVDVSVRDSNIQGKISNESSHNNSVITAYTHANKVDNEINIDYKLKSLTVYTSNSNNLEIGDEIVEINNKVINTKSYETYLKELNIYDGSRYIRKNDLELKILRKNKEIKVNLTKEEALYFYPKYEILETTPKYLGFTEKFNVGGPSGGLIQAATIYSSLLELDLGNIKIAGTGTIETDNEFSVGKIGGVVQKYYTVLNSKYDYFIIPKSNDYEEVDNKNGTDLLPKELKNNDKLIVKSVSTFQEFLDYLGEIIK